MKNLRCFLLIVCLLIAATAHAGSDITLFGAAQHEGKLTLQSAQSVATSVSNFNPGTFGTFGVRFGQGKVFGHEQTIAYSPNFISSDTSAFIYNGDVLVQAPLPKFKPYLTGGLGTIITWGTDSAGRPAFGKIGSKFAINYGGGVKILPAGPVGVRFDIRGYTIPSVHFNIPTLTSPTATVQSSSQTLNLLEVGVGVIFNF